MNIIVFLAIVPIYVICNYVYEKDHVKESSNILTKLFILGILSCFLVLILSTIEENIFPFFAQDTKDLNATETFIYTFFGVGIIEEFSKWTMLYFGAYKSREYDEIYDGIVYAVFVSLGFAAFENLLYVITSQNSLMVAGLRAVTAVPAHACFGIVMGSFFSLAKISSKEGKTGNEILYLILSILVPALLHAIYDYILILGNPSLLLVGLVFVIILYICCIKKIKKESNNNLLI